ncbi:MAG: hypothetical protein NVS3B26_28660 [Mycobacteriales bacterium]
MLDPSQDLVKPGRGVFVEGAGVRRLRVTEDERPTVAVSLVLDVERVAVGGAWYFDIDLFTRHAALGISLERTARSRGLRHSGHRPARGLRVRPS